MARFRAVRRTRPPANVAGHLFGRVRSTQRTDSAHPERRTAGTGEPRLIRERHAIPSRPQRPCPSRLGRGHPTPTSDVAPLSGLLGLNREPQWDRRQGLDACPALLPVALVMRTFALSMVNRSRVTTGICFCRVPPPGIRRSTATPWCCAEDGHSRPIPIPSSAGAESGRSPRDRFGFAVAQTNDHVSSIPGRRLVSMRTCVVDSDIASLREAANRDEAASTARTLTFSGAGDQRTVAVPSAPRTAERTSVQVPLVFFCTTACAPAALRIAAQGQRPALPLR